MGKAKYKVGQTVYGNTMDGRMEGVIEQVDTHKGQIVYDLEGQDCYIYEHQVRGTR